MSEYMLLVADIDGTVVDHGSNGEEIHAEHPSKLAVAAAQEAGKYVTFATGRNFEWAQSVITAFNIHSPVIVNNGSRIVDPVTCEATWEKRLDIELGRKIYNFITNENLANDSKIGFGYLQEKVFSEVRSEDIDNLIYLDLIGFEDDSAITSIVEFVDTLDQATVAVVPSPQFHGRSNLLITHVDGTKYHAMQQLQIQLGIAARQTIAIGDGKNDLPLFRASALKIAVDNAADELKAASDVVVSSVHENGLVEAIDNYLLA